MNEIKKILVASTSTTTCRKAVHYGVALARELGAELYLYHSDHVPFDLEGWGLPIPSLQTLRESYQALLVEDRAVLDNIIEQEKTSDMKIRIFVNDKPMTKEIPRLVAEEGIDLLVMTAFEEGRLEHLFFSSGTAAIIRKMPCSIMLVKEVHSLEEVEEEVEEEEEGEHPDQPRGDFQRP